MAFVRIAAAALLIAAVLAPQGAAAAGRARAKYNPNQTICESRDEIGSRLKKIRVCHTAQEWEEVRTQEKVGLMRRQFNGSPGGGASNVRDAPH
ncbi:MAG: hypothetical protein QOJ27_1681 [Sphingomonadales bacterium]|nr:hypothetical protein [Sphingomonadales bacterium]